MDIGFSLEGSMMNMNIFLITQHTRTIIKFLSHPILLLAHAHHLIKVCSTNLNFNWTLYFFFVNKCIANLKNQKWINQLQQQCCILKYYTILFAAKFNQMHELLIRKLITKFNNSGCQEDLKRVHIVRNRMIRWKKNHPANGAFEESDDLSGHLFLPLLLDYKGVMTGHHEVRGVQLRLFKHGKFDQFGIDLTDATLVEIGCLRFVQFVAKNRNITLSGVHCHFLLNAVLQMLPRNVSSARDCVSPLIRINGSRSQFAYQCQVPQSAAPHVCFVLVSLVREQLNLKTLVRSSEGVDPSERFTILPVQNALTLDDKTTTPSPTSIRLWYLRWETNHPTRDSSIELKNTA